MWKKAEKLVVKDEYIGPLVIKHGPCIIHKSAEEDYFEDLVVSIVEQQLSGKAAKSNFWKSKNPAKKKLKYPTLPYFPGRCIANIRGNIKELRYFLVKSKIRQRSGRKSEWVNDRFKEVRQIRRRSSNFRIN